MKNVLFVLTFTLIGTFTFASTGEVSIEPVVIEIETTSETLEKKDLAVCSWCVKAGETTNCATAETCPEARRLALAMAIDEQQ